LSETTRTGKKRWDVRNSCAVRFAGGMGALEPALVERLRNNAMPSRS
jgi:hypothetical protein